MLFSSDPLGKVLAGAAAIAVAAGIALAVSLGDNSDGGDGGGNSSKATSNLSPSQIERLSTSLIYEMRNKNPENVKMLIDQGANPNLVYDCESVDITNIPIGILATYRPSDFDFSTFPGSLDKFREYYINLDSNRFNTAYYLLPILNKKGALWILANLSRHPNTNNYVRQLYYDGYFNNFSDEEKSEYYLYTNYFRNIVIPEFSNYATNYDKTFNFLPPISRGDDYPIIWDLMGCYSDNTKIYHP